MLVQNRINLALPLLPDVVKQAGVTTRKPQPRYPPRSSLVYSPNGRSRYDQVYLSNFVTIKIRDEISRVDGVGDCQQFGQQDYSMRLWVDPERLSGLNLTANDVADALREQNMQVAAGHFGQQPVPNSSHFEFTITTLGRLSTPEQFENIVLRTDREGHRSMLKDVGRAQLGAKNEDTTSKVNGKPNGSLAVFPLPDANSIAVAQRVRERMEELKKSFPEDIDYVISLDMTPFMEESIHQVIRTLIEAIVLVAAVVLLFLQNWRSALIPLVAVPVAVVGTFAVMAAIGFSLNNLTLFGLVLAIGIVVDDAIVVVRRWSITIEELGLSPRRAAHKAMDQVSGPVVAVALVLSAVFVPCAFITGITGQFFRQFALTIAVSTVISAFNSLTLSPALAAKLLKPREKNTRTPLPRFGCVLVGGILGFVLLARLGPWVWGAGILIGMIAGWLAAPWLARSLAQENSEGFRRLRVRLMFAILGAWLGINYLAPAIPAGLTHLAHQLPEPDETALLAMAPWVGWLVSGFLVAASLAWFAVPKLLGGAFRSTFVRLVFVLIAAGLVSWLGAHYLAPVAPWVGWWINGLLAGSGRRLVRGSEPPGGGAEASARGHPLAAAEDRLCPVCRRVWVPRTGAVDGARGGLAGRALADRRGPGAGGRPVGGPGGGGPGGAPLGWFLGPVLNWLLGWFFGVFNLAFQAGTNWYT